MKITSWYWKNYDRHSLRQELIMTIMKNLSFLFIALELSERDLRMRKGSSYLQCRFQWNWSNQLESFYNFTEDRLINRAHLTSKNFSKRTFNRTILKEDKSSFASFCQTFLVEEQRGGTANRKKRSNKRGKNKNKNTKRKKKKLVIIFREKRRRWN